jgi:hypothetical protein
MSEELRKEFNAIYNQLFKDFKIYKNADLRKAFRCLRDEAYKIINHSLTLRADLDRVTRERDALKGAAEEAIKWMNQHGERHHTPCGCTYCRNKAALAAVKPETCVWTWIDDPYPGGWKTSCKHQRSDYDGRCKKPVGICPYCHKPIEQKEV